MKHKIVCYWSLSRDEFKSTHKKYVLTHFTVHTDFLLKQIHFHAGIISCLLQHCHERFAFDRFETTPPYCRKVLYLSPLRELGTQTLPYPLGRRTFILLSVSRSCSSWCADDSASSRTSVNFMSFSCSCSLRRSTSFSGSATSTTSESNGLNKEDVSVT